MNDFAYFAAVVRYGGFSAAGRVLGLPKSKLSRHITALEDRLGVRLIERTVNRFRVTEIGQSLYVYCENMLREAERATKAVNDANGEPQGTIRLSVPTGLLEGSLGAIFPEFLLLHPKIQLQILATDHRVDIINDRLDLAIRAQLTEETDAELTMRVLSKVDLILVASKDMAARLPAGEGIESLDGVPTVSFTSGMAEWREIDVWDFTGRDGALHRHEHRPRMSCRSFPRFLKRFMRAWASGFFPISFAPKACVTERWSACCLSIRCPRRPSIWCSRHRVACRRRCARSSISSSSASAPLTWLSRAIAPALRE
jgi:DNA-binding transcriptional LysR family regulator